MYTNTWCNFLFDRQTSIFRSTPNFFGISNTPFDFDFVCITARSPTVMCHKISKQMKNIARPHPPHTHTHTFTAFAQIARFLVRFLCIHGTYVRARSFGYVSNDTNINCLQQKRREKIAGKNILITAISNKRSFFSPSPYRVTPSMFCTQLYTMGRTNVYITYII